MKIMVVGCRGMLGTDLIAELENEHEVTGVDIDEMDITCPEQVERQVDIVRPHVLINCAAYTDVDGCETNQETAYMINATGPRNLASACSMYGAAMLHISTDYVFDGKKGRPYIETDPVNPLSVYGKSKLRGEEYVREQTDRCYIVRTQWLYGAHGKNFVKTMLRLATERKEITVVNDQFGSPTYTVDLCRAISQLIQHPVYGTYHITNSGIASWYEFTNEIFRAAEIDVAVKPCATEEFPRPAVRPAYSPLENRYWLSNGYGYSPLRPYQEALAEYIQSEKS